MTTSADARVFASLAAYADPKSWHAATTPLREQAPVVSLTDTEIAPLWAALRHAEVLEVERNHEVFTNSPACSMSQAHARVEPDSESALMKTLVEMDGAEHQAHRLVANKWFLPASIRRLEDAIAVRAEEAVQVMADAGGSCDFAQDVALQYPLKVIMTLFGLPDTDFDFMLGLTQALMEAQDPALGDQAVATMIQFFEYFQELAESRRAHPTDDLASVIANAEIDGQPVDALGAFGLYLVIATAGHDTTSSAVAGGLEALIDHPGQLQALRDNPGLMANATEEIIRWVSPVKHFLRTAQADFELGGESIARGDRVFLSYPSANRDDLVFDKPHTFDVGRHNADQHIAFGFGRHYCLGAHLARLEVRKFFEILVPRLARIEATGPCVHLASNLVSGPVEQPIRYTLSF